MNIHSELCFVIFNELKLLICDTKVIPPLCDIIANYAVPTIWFLHEDRKLNLDNLKEEPFRRKECSNCPIIHDPVPKCLHFRYPYPISNPKIFVDQSLTSYLYGQLRHDLNSVSTTIYKFSFQTIINGIHIESSYGALYMIKLHEFPIIIKHLFKINDIMYIVTKNAIFTQNLSLVFPIVNNYDFECCFCHNNYLFLASQKYILYKDMKTGKEILEISRCGKLTPVKLSFGIYFLDTQQVFSFDSLQFEKLDIHKFAKDLLLNQTQFSKKSLFQLHQNLFYE